MSNTRRKRGNEEISREKKKMLELNKQERAERGKVKWTCYLGAGFESPEGTGFEDDPVPLAKDEGDHPDHHHQQEQRRENRHDPQVIRGRLHHSCKDTRLIVCTGLCWSDSSVTRKKKNTEIKTLLHYSKVNKQSCVKCREQTVKAA